VRRPQLAGDADPRESDDEEDLGEGEVANPELLLERRAVSFDLRFRAHARCVDRT